LGVSYNGHYWNFCEEYCTGCGLSWRVTHNSKEECVSPVNPVLDWIYEKEPKQLA
jgi:hypothetical protein